MNHYSLLKFNQFIKSYRLKFLGIFLLHIMRRRYLAIFFDPVNACNLRCRMCYFTDTDYVKRLKGIFTEENVQILAQAFFKRALKLQIGCGTEPTLYKDISSIIKLGKEYAIPHISLTTNGNLLKKDLLKEWIILGLSEITISLHGVHKESYEYMMGNGNFDVFMDSLRLITELKKKHNLTLRINYTFNEDNFLELRSFFQIYDEIDIDILQIRPIVKLGNTAYSNFSMDKIIPHYDDMHLFLSSESKKRKISFISHSPSQLKSRTSLNSVINKYIYCYISPSSLYNKNFDWGKETYDEYAQRTRIVNQLWKDIFSSKQTILKNADDKLNYEIIN